MSSFPVHCPFPWAKWKTRFSYLLIVLRFCHKAQVPRQCAFDRRLDRPLIEKVQRWYQCHSKRGVSNQAIVGQIWPFIPRFICEQVSCVLVRALEFVFSMTSLSFFVKSVFPLIKFKIFKKKKKEKWYLRWELYKFQLNVKVRNQFLRLISYPTNQLHWLIQYLFQFLHPEYFHNCSTREKSWLCENRKIR